ncbi:hypothetical protein BT96DRAFT_941189 [Gymnopus androsaceus JB14]|uniref:Uncharacterized protein n=1 Tax=Gymnopus androsaceus JB14 TaxID=1447944 RepID=A0A6A4HGQ4_9AGAR|nr:hypothetical protein BT96DRAFT_941189 [Gymnopus androsaceus JB14]
MHGEKILEIQEIQRMKELYILLWIWHLMYSHTLYQVIATHLATEFRRCRSLHRLGRLQTAVECAHTVNWNNKGHSNKTKPCQVHQNKNNSKEGWSKLNAGVPRVIKLQRIKQTIPMRRVPLVQKPLSEARSSHMYWSLFQKPGLAENMTDDGTDVVPSRKRRQPRKKDVDAGGIKDTNVKQPPKKKRT